MKPKFKLFKNIGYALAGFQNILKQETAFKIQVVTFVIFSVGLIFLDIRPLSKMILFTSMIFVLAGEAINSSIERIVDLVSPDYHILAKQAKDIGALIVLLFFLMNGCIWLTTLLWEFGFI